MKTVSNGLAPIVIILIVAAVLALAGGGYYVHHKFSPRANPASAQQANQQVTSRVEIANPVRNGVEGWKTYTNEQYGFELQYPANYQVSTSIGKHGFYDRQVTTIAKFSGSERYVNSAYFAVSADNDRLNLSACLNDDNHPTSAPLTRTKNINGNEFYVFEENAEDAAMGGWRGSVSQYRIIRNGYCYILESQVDWQMVGYERSISTGHSSASPDETQAQNDAVVRNERLLDQILSSFKFVNEPHACGSAARRCAGGPR